MRRLLASLLTLIAGAAHAAPPAIGTFAPPASDPALGSLGQLTGDIGGIGFFPGGMDADVTGMFMVFNTATVAVAALFFLWNLISSTIAASHDGEFLGRRYHSYWMPLRMFTGIFFIMPMFGGWSFAQVLMAWMAWGGVGIANSISTHTVPAMAALQAKHTAAPRLPELESAVRELSALHDRIIVMRQSQRERKAEGGTPATDPYLGVNFVTSVAVAQDGKSIEIVAGANPPAHNYDVNSLGSYRYEISSAKATYTQSAAMHTAYRGAVLQALQDVNVQLSAHSNKLADIDPMSSQWPVENAKYKAAQMLALNGALTRVALELEAAKTGASAAPIGQIGTGNTIAQQFGWIGTGLGIIDGTITSYQASSIIGAGRAAGPTAAETEGSGDVWARLNNAIEPTVIANTRDTLSKNAAANRAAADVAWESGSYAASAWESTKAFISDTSETALNILGKSPVGVVMKAGENLSNMSLSDFDPRTWPDKFNSMMQDQILELRVAVKSMMLQKGDPIAAMQNLGIWIIGSVSGTVMAIGGVLIAAMVIAFFLPQGGAGAIGSFLSFFATIAVIALAPLFFFGLKLAAILPFHPLVAWLSAVANYFLIFIESLFGAQLWALVHLDPDGDGMGQQTKHGYVFTLNLLFRPGIMVICYLLALKLLGVMGGLAVAGIANVLDSVTANDSNGWLAPLVLTIGSIWIWVALMETLIHACMSIVNVVPSQVITWIGGTFGSDVGGEMRGTTNQAASTMSGAGGVGQRFVDTTAPIVADKAATGSNLAGRKVGADKFAAKMARRLTGRGPAGGGDKPRGSDPAPSPGSGGTKPEGSGSDTGGSISSGDPKK